MKKLLFAVSAALIVVSTSCLKDKEKKTEQGDSPVVINEAYSRGLGSYYAGMDWVEL